MVAREDALRICPIKGENPLDNDDFEKLIQRFNKTVAISGILREVKSRRFFEPASVRRRRKHLDEVRRRRNL